MLKATLFASGASRSLDVDEIPDARKSGEGMIWVDVADPTDADLVALTDLFSTGSFILDSGERWRRRPRLQASGDTVVVVGYAKVADSTDLAEIDVSLGRGWLVSVRRSTESGHAYDMSEVTRRFEETVNRTCDPGMALYLILDDIVDGHFDAVEDVEDALEAVEEIMFDDVSSLDERSRNHHVQHELLRMRRGLILLRRKVVPMRDVVRELARGEMQWMEPSTVAAMQNLLDHMLRLVDQIDTQRELLGNVVDAHLNLQANSMSQVMKKMTSWAAILVVASVITGIYGMNFTHMPELRWRFGYPLAILLILSCTGGLWLYFKRKDWL